MDRKKFGLALGVVGTLAIGFAGAAVAGTEPTTDPQTTSAQAPSQEAAVIETATTELITTTTAASADATTDAEVHHHIEETSQTDENGNCVPDLELEKVMIQRARATRAFVASVIPESEDLEVAFATSSSKLAEALRANASPIVIFADRENTQSDLAAIERFIARAKSTLEQQALEESAYIEFGLTQTIDENKIDFAGISVSLESDLADEVGLNSFTVTHVLGTIRASASDSYEFSNWVEGLVPDGTISCHAC